VVLANVVFAARLASVVVLTSLDGAQPSGRDLIASPKLALYERLLECNGCKEGDWLADVDEARFKTESVGIRKLLESRVLI
jgi:hypothetical protein